MIGNRLVARDERERVAITQLIARLQECAAAYFPELSSSPPDVRLASHVTRPDSQNDLYEFSLSCRSAALRVIVKVRFPWKTATRPGAGHVDRLPDLPRFSGPVEPALKTMYESAAMSALMASTTQHPDDRLGSVRILDVLTAPHALIMEKRPEKNLRRLLVSAPIGSGAIEDPVLSAMRNAGTWLRRFHALPDLPHTRSCEGRPSEFVDSLTRLTEYLCRRVRSVRFLEGIFSKSVMLARTHLPDRLPMGLSHGDFSLTNVLVGAQGRVTVLDTFALWRSPIYEDISQFLVALKCPGPHQWRTWIGAEHRTVERWEREFLAGYFAGESVPLTWIRLFECRFLLERWAWLVHASLEARGWRRTEKICRVTVWSWFARRLLDRLVQEAAGATTNGGACVEEMPKL